MADVIKYRFRCRRRTAAEWTTVNEVLLDSEIGLEEDTGLGKIGDGSTAWNDLLYTIVGEVNLNGLADGKCLAWNATHGYWYVADRGVAYTAGAGIDINASNPNAPVISSTLGSIALSGNPDTYGDLPTGLGPGDAGKAYLVKADELVYIWNGSAFPDKGNGISLSGNILTSGTALKRQIQGSTVIIQDPTLSFGSKLITPAWSPWPWTTNTQSNTYQTSVVVVRSNESGSLSLSGSYLSLQADILPGWLSLSRNTLSWENVPEGHYSIYVVANFSLGSKGGILLDFISSDSVLPFTNTDAAGGSTAGWTNTIGTLLARNQGNGGYLFFNQSSVCKSHQDLALSGDWLTLAQTGTALLGFRYTETFWNDTDEGTTVVSCLDSSSNVLAAYGLPSGHRFDGSVNNPVGVCIAGAVPAATTIMRLEYQATRHAGTDNNYHAGYYSVCMVPIGA